MKCSEAIILAGGLGSRLSGVLPGVAKCTIPINGTPFLGFVLDRLIDSGVNRIIISVGYLSDQVEAAVLALNKNCKIEFISTSDFFATANVNSVASNTPSI